MADPNAPPSDTTGVNVRWFLPAPARANTGMILQQWDTASSSWIVVPLVNADGTAGPTPMIP